MDQKKAEDQVKHKPSRVWTTQGVPNKPLPKTWSGSGKVIRDTQKGGGNEK